MNDSAFKATPCLQEQCDANYLLLDQYVGWVLHYRNSLVWLIADYGKA